MNPFKDIVIRGIIVLIVGMALTVAMLWIQGCAHLQKTAPSEFVPFEYGFKTSLSKHEQYERSLLWAANTYRNINTVMSYRSEETGAIRGKSRACLPYRGGDRCATYHIDIDCKDGYVKMTFHTVDGYATMQNGAYVPGLDLRYAEQYAMARKHFGGLALKWMGTL